MTTQEAFTPTVEGESGCDHVFTPWQGNEHMSRRECGQCGQVEFRSRSLGSDEPLVEAMTVAALVTLTVAGVPEDVLTMLNHGNGRGCVAPNAFRRSQRAALGALRAAQAVDDDALVEIMARAIAAARHNNHFPLLPWSFYAPDARAALNALREHGKENT